MLGRLGRIAKNTIALDRAKVLIRIWGKKDVQTFIVDLNRVEQLLKQGIDSDGDAFGSYARNYKRVAFKGVSKQRKKNENILLLDTGDFYRSFDIKILSGGFSITANDNKGGKSLTNIYGKEILGLTNDSKNELIKKILPILIKDTRRAILA